LRLDFEKGPIHPSPLGPSILTGGATDHQVIGHVGDVQLLQRRLEDKVGGAKHYLGRLDRQSMCQNVGDGKKHLEVKRGEERSRLPTPALEQKHKPCSLRSRHMENPVRQLPVGETDKEVCWVVANHHRRIRVDLEETGEVLLHLGQQHKRPSPTHHRGKGFLQLRLRCIHGCHSRDDPQLKTWAPPKDSRR
jgi:hypothetical protein